jgi:hypothetical protein
MTQLSRLEREALLRGYLRGAFDFEEFARRLKGYLRFAESESANLTEFRVDVDHQLEVQIVLTPAELRPVLNAFLCWELDETALARWASVLLMLDAFENPPELSDEEADDIMEPLWEVLWDLSAGPGATSMRERVETALADLAEVDVKLAARAV